jgi:hypothetical protein
MFANLRAGSGERERFKQDLSADLAAATALPSPRFDIKSLSPGSVIVDVEIMPAQTPHAAGSGLEPAAIARDLVKQAAEASSKLRTGKLTSAVKHVAVFGTVRSAPPPRQQAVVDKDAHELLSKMKQALEDSSREKAATKKLTDKIEADLTNHVQAANHELNAAQNEIQRLNKEIAQLEETLHQERAEKRNIARALSEKGGEIKLMMVDMDSLKTENEMLKNLNKSLDSNLRACKQELENAAKVVKAARSASLEARSLDTSTSEAHRKLNDQNAELFKAYDKIRLLESKLSDVSTSEEQVGRLHDQVEDLRKQWQLTHEREYAEFQQQLQRKEQRNQELQMEIDAMNLKIKTLSPRVQSSNSAPESQKSSAALDKPSSVGLDKASSAALDKAYDKSELDKPYIPKLAVDKTSSASPTTGPDSRPSPRSPEPILSPNGSVRGVIGMKISNTTHQVLSVTELMDEHGKIVNDAVALGDELVAIDKIPVATMPVTYMIYIYAYTNVFAYRIIAYRLRTFSNIHVGNIVC